MNNFEIVSIDTNEYKKYLKKKDKENNDYYEVPTYNLKDKIESKITYANLERVFSNKKYKRAMKELTLIEKKIIFLKYVDKMDNKDISTSLDIPIRLVEEIADYAKERFKKYLNLFEKNELENKKIILEENDNNNNTKIIYKKVLNEFNRIGYINLNFKKVNKKDDLVQITQIFRDPRYETFRLIYMKGNIIVGHDSVSSKIPTFSCVFNREKDGSVKVEKNFYKIKDRMRRLGADGYYMVHNHPSGRAKASKNDLSTTKFFNSKIKGFKGHLIVNNESYAWIDVDEINDAVIVEDEMPIISGKIDKNNYITKYSGINKKDAVIVDNKDTVTQIENTKIKSRKDLVKLMHNIKNSPNYSIAFLTDMSGGIRMVLDIPNRFMNVNENEVKNYFKNVAKKMGVSKVIFVTDNEEVYNKTFKHFINGTFVDVIYYREENSQLIVSDYENVLSKRKYTNLFEEDYTNYFTNKKKVSVCENEFNNGDEVDMDMDYYDLEFDREIKDNKELVILYKEVGKNPVVKKIKNTLEAKQELVGGYIEVVPFDDFLLVCNDEGKILNMKPNLVFDFDYIAGNCFIIGDDYERGDFKSLNREEIVYLKEKLNKYTFKYPVQRTISRKKGNFMHGEKFR